MDIPRQPDATAHGKPEYASKELCCRFRFATAFSGKFGFNNHSRKASFCRAEFSKQVVLLWPQNFRFVLTKVTCRMLVHQSGWPLFRMAKEGPGNLTTNVSKYEESENQVHQGQNDTGGSTTV